MGLLCAVGTQQCGRGAGGARQVHSLEASCGGLRALQGNRAAPGASLSTVPLHRDQPEELLRDLSLKEGLAARERGETAQSLPCFFL